FQAEDGIRDLYVTGVQTCALPILVRVVPGTAAGTIISDTATVTTTTRDTVAGNNSATVNIAVGVAGQADMRVSNVGVPDPVTARSEERRVGKEGRDRWWAHNGKKK